MTKAPKALAIAALVALMACGDARGAGADESAVGLDAKPARVDDGVGSANGAGEVAAITVFLDTVFGSYANGDPVGYALGSGAVFEPALAQRMRELQDGQIGNGAVTHEVLSYDPICGCQDWHQTAHAILDVRVDGKRAKARLSFTNYGETQARVVDLRRTDQGWRIYDLDGQFREEAFAN